MAVTANEIERLVVAIDANAKDYLQELSKAQNESRVWGVAIGNIISTGVTKAFSMAAHAARAGVASITGFLKQSVMEAGNAMESLSAFQQVFGDLTGEVSAEIERFAAQVGRSSVVLKDGATGLQAFFVGMGFARKEAAKMSLQLQKAAVDMGSFRNVADDEMIWRFRSALSGSSEVLDQFGINIKASALEQEALAKGFKKSFNQLSELEKVTLRMGVIMKSMTAQGAVGDAVRTAESFANRNRAVTSQLGQLRIEIGMKLVPIMNNFLGLISEVVSGMLDWIGRNEETIDSLASTGTAVTDIQTIMKNLRQTWRDSATEIIRWTKEIEFIFRSLQINFTRIASVIADVLIKPFDVMEKAIRKAANNSLKVMAEVARLVKEQLSDRLGFENVSGEMQAIMDLSRKFDRETRSRGSLMSELSTPETQFGADMRQQARIAARDLELERGEFNAFLEDFAKGTAMAGKEIITFEFAMRDMVKAIDRAVTATRSQIENQRKLADIMSEGSVFRIFRNPGQMFGEFFTGIGEQINEIMKSTPGERIRETGGQAILAGTSEGLSFKNISTRTANENRKRDELLQKTATGVGKVVDSIKELIGVTRDNSSNTPTPVGID